MPKWIRVRDTQTGHQFDVDARVLEYRRGVEPVNDPERWPDVEGPRARPRPAKPFVGKDGQAATPARSVVTGPPPDGGEAFIPRGEVQPHSTGNDNPASSGGPVSGGGTRRSSIPASTPDVVPADTSKEQ